MSLILNFNSICDKKNLKVRCYCETKDPPPDLRILRERAAKGIIKTALRIWSTINE